MSLPELWTLIRADLTRARNTLPDGAASHNAVVEYEEFLNHNERELACDMLEVYAQGQRVSKEFWLALGDAAARMQLPDRARRYKKYAENFRISNLTGK